MTKWDNKRVNKTPRGNHLVEGVYYKSLRQVANHYGISYNAFYNRMARANPPITAEEAVMEWRSKLKKGTPVIFNDKEYPSISAVTKSLGLTDKYSAKRLSVIFRKTGWPMELCVKALLDGDSTGTLCYYNGEVYMSFASLCRAHGTKLNNVHGYMSYHGIKNVIDGLDSYLKSKKQSI